MSLFTIQSLPPVLFGEGSSAETGKKLKELGCTRVFCVYDPGIKSAGIVDPVIDYIKSAGIQVVEYDRVQPDPTVSSVEEAGNAARKEKIDGIVGLGGGSSMDTAKGVNVLVGNPGPLATYLGMQSFFMKQEKGVPLVLMPTTSGTSSEISRAYTVINDATGEKTPGAGPNATATLAIVDPELTLKLPPSITALTGVDALSHGAEAITNESENIMADILGEEGVKLAFENLPRVYENGMDREARKNMSFACIIIGYAFMNNGTHIGHAVADAVIKICHPQHAAGVSVGLPFLAKYCAVSRPEKVKRLARAIGLKPDDKISAKELGDTVADTLRELTCKIGMKDMKGLGIKESDLNELATVTVDNGRFTLPGVIKPDFNLVLKILAEEFNYPG